MSRKPFWDWKARGCAEVSEYYTVPFAVKEYIQNQVGQVLKEKLEREWADWCREDLRGSTAKERKDRKAHLVQTLPGLLTGPHGALIKRAKDWEPIYILSGVIHQSQLRLIHYTTDLKICTVMWKHASTGMTGFTFFNNHMDPIAGFSTFVTDGASTSRRDLWAVGEKGKGFKLATQYLYEAVETNLREHDSPINSPTKSSTKPKVSFRVGNKIGELLWKKARNPEEEDLLRVTMDDLSPVTVEEVIQRQAPNKEESSEDESDTDDLYLAHFTPVSSEKHKKAMKTLVRIYKRRFTQQLAIKGKHIAEACQPSHEVPLVSTDEVSITVLELSRTLQPEYIFSGMYGIIPPPQSWRVTGTDFVFFKSDDQPIFYNRDQVLISAPPLNRLGMNYHGDLKVTADRVGIVMGKCPKYQRYLQALGSAADIAFRTMPELSIQVACDILTDDNQGVGSIAYHLEPVDGTAGKAFRTAFTAAWRILDPDLPQDKTLYACKPEKAANDLVKELGMVPVTVESERIRGILDGAGAFKDIYCHAENLLTKTRRYAGTIPGFERLQNAIARLLPSVDPSSIVLRDYRFSYPKVMWDSGSKTLSIAIPADCSVHPEDECLCWLGPCLTSAISSWSKNQKGIEEPSQAAIFRTFMWAMDGLIDMKEPKVVDSKDLEFGISSDSGDSDDKDDPPPPSPGVHQSTHRDLEGFRASPEPTASDSSHTLSQANGNPPAPEMRPTSPRPFVAPLAATRNEIPKAAPNSSFATAQATPLAIPPLAIPESHPLMRHFRGLQSVFDQQASRADNANTQLEALRTQLFEEQTVNATRQSLIEEREREMNTMQGELVEQRSLIEEVIDPVRAMLDKLSRSGESGTKRQRDEHGREEGSSKRARQ